MARIVNTETARPIMRRSCHLLRFNGKTDLGAGSLFDVEVLSGVTLTNSASVEELTSVDVTKLMESAILSDEEVTRLLTSVDTSGIDDVGIAVVVGPKSKTHKSFNLPLIKKITFKKIYPLKC